jgi:hypothetical protein
VVLVGGVAVKKNRELMDNRWDKHDTKDAANVADLISCCFANYFDQSFLIKPMHSNYFKGSSMAPLRVP